jgi:hypothetical protein
MRRCTRECGRCAGAASLSAAGAGVRRQRWQLRQGAELHQGDSIGNMSQAIQQRQDPAVHRMRGSRGWKGAILSSSFGSSSSSSSSSSRGKVVDYS